ncbi:hypothetical protein ACX0HA_12830 [Flavobacterium hauense]
MNQTDNSSHPGWGFLKKFLFRFFFALCVISIFPIVSGLLWPQIIEWTSNYFYNEAVTSHPSGSGDTLYDFYEVTIKFIIAAVAALVWTIIDRRRSSYNTLLYWQEVYIRYYLGYFLLVYGLMKVIKLQFGEPLLSALLIPLGQKSPMGLAWTFIGFSDTYTIFSGLCEVVAAGLLFYRKTRTLGALLCFGVMFNVFLMNMSYDIPVKLFSLKLVILAGFLIGLDYKRLLNVFILNKNVEPQQSRSPFDDKTANLAVLIIKCLALLGGFGFMLFTNLQSYSLYGDSAPKPPMYGIYEIEEFILNKDTIAPMINDTIRWRYLVIEKDDKANIFTMQSAHYDDLQFFIPRADTLKKELLLLNYQDSTQVAKLRYHKTDGKHYTFNGVFKGDTINLRTIRKDENDFPLMSNKFKWINEYPYNR